MTTASERLSIEKQLFVWENFDEFDVGDLQFYDVTLSVPIGEFPVGTKFPCAFLLVSQSLLSLVDEKEQEHLFALNISVGEKLDPKELYPEDTSLSCEDDCQCHLGSEG
jgi:hypothetical protein